MMKDRYQLPTDPVFSKAFLERGIEDIVLWDVIKIKSGTIIRIRFEDKNSDWDQGVMLISNLGFKIMNESFPSSVEFWMNDKSIHEIACYSDNGMLHVYNIWNRGNGRESQSWTSGMRISANDNTRVYQCNDIGFGEEFDKLIFTITIEQPQ